MDWTIAFHTLGVAWASVASIRLIDHYWPSEPPKGVSGYWFMAAVGILVALSFNAH